MHLNEGNLGTICSQVVIRVTTFLLVGFSLLENLNAFITAPQNPHSENGASQSSYTTLPCYIVVSLKTSPKKLYFDQLLICSLHKITVKLHLCTPKTTLEAFTYDYIVGKMQLRKNKYCHFL